MQFLEILVRSRLHCYLIKKNQQPTKQTKKPEQKKVIRVGSHGPVP